MKRFRSVWGVVASLAIGNGFFAAGFAGRQKAPIPSLLTVKLYEDRGVSSISERNATFRNTDCSADAAEQKKRPNPSKQEFPVWQGNKNETRTDANEEARISFLDACKYVRALSTPWDVDGWMRYKIGSNPDIFNRWRIKAQIDFVKLLQEKNAYDSVMMFLRQIKKAEVKVCTTAMFGFALSINHRPLAIDVLNLMDERGVEPTSLTFVAVLGSVDGAKAVSSLMRRIESYKRVELNDEVFNSAIFACKRRSSDGSTSAPWQTALNMLQVMRRKRINPTVKTYHALLQVLGGTGQVQMAKSLLQQLQSTSGLEADNRVWAAAINICADIGDYDGAIHFVREMNAHGHPPNLLVCSVLLKAFALGAQDELALQALEMMVGRYAKEQPGEISTPPPFHLPQVPPDRIALNTVISACAKAKNLSGALEVLERMKRGEFVDPENGQEVTPDLISYHNILKFCTDPEFAMSLVKDMRLSRRSRVGVITPSSSTYAHAINACQQAVSPSSECAATLLKWALDDGIKPTVYMYAPAIWAAQKSGDRATALNFFVQMTELGCSPNSVAYNGVISALCDNGDVDHAILIYEEMRERGMCANGPVFKRFAKSIQSLEMIEERKQYLERIVSLMDRSEKTIGSGGSIFVLLMSVYGMLGLIDEALETFYGIAGQIDAQCLRSILLACSRANPPRWKDAITILHTSDIVEESDGPGRIDQGALSYAVMACSKANEFEEALTLLRLYGRNTQYGSGGRTANALSVASLNALIAACGRCRKPDLSLEILSTMERRYGVRPDSRSYRNAAIACNKAQHEALCLSIGDTATSRSEGRPVYRWWECALALLRRMREDGLVPDVATYSATISACESAGEWQRALGVLQAMMNDEDDVDKDHSLLNLYCFNAAISACEKGHAWVEALELYERMLEIGGSVQPNVVTLNSLLESLENAGQKELATSKYIEGRKLNIVNPWRQTKALNGEFTRAMDLHNFSGAMARAAVRTYMDGNIIRNQSSQATEDLLIIPGKGIHSEKTPVLRQAVMAVLSDEFGVKAILDESNQGRIIVPAEELERYIAKNRW